MGGNTETIRLVTSGTTVTTEDYYQTESTISLATATAYHVLTVRHPMVQILMTARASSTSSSEPDSSGISLFGLSQLFRFSASPGASLPHTATNAGHTGARPRPSKLPLVWHTEQQLEDLVVDMVVQDHFQRIEENACSHGAAGLWCLRCIRGSKKCCACVDTRRNLILPREDRVRTYCTECSKYYTEHELADCPMEWRLAGVQCRHARSKACAKATQWETTCCVCNDTRTGAMPRADRTATIHANHSDMVKFASAEENGFKRLVGELVRWASQVNHPRASQTGELP
ncbi:hypothetical protein DL767_000363 [Monosporascus sp. MG133]|nr:hypothetical protein DL767_000363 [Monosporascus sp. MG133]